MRGAPPLQRPEQSRIPGHKTETAFDAFDDEREEDALSHYGHHAVPSGYGRQTGRWVSAFGVVIAIVLGAAFFTVSNIRAREKFELEQETASSVSALPRVDVMDVKPAPKSQTLTLPGETSAWYRTTIYSRVSGYLDKWYVDIGDRVKKGQVLATIDTPDLDSQLDAARAELNAAEAETKVKESDAEFARTSYDRWRDSPAGVVSVQEREAKKAAFDSSVAQLNAARARVNVDRAKVNGLTSLAAFKSVSAPFDGVITERRIDPGDLVTAGSTASTTPLFVIEQADRIRVFTSVPQDVAEKLKVGSPVRVLTAGGSGRAYEGQIVRTTGSLDPRARTMRVEADLPNPDYALAPGMYVRTEIQFTRHASMQLPASALIFRSDEPQVAVVGKDDKIEFRNVVIASDDGNSVEISSGVSEGERVALNISSRIANGQKVAVEKTSEAAD
jgi:RND family efflux transporter MFP subunit